MSLIASKTASGGNRIQAPVGSYTGFLREIKDLGVRPTPYGKHRHRVGLIFELDAQAPDWRPLEICQWLTLSLHERSRMAQFLADWLDVSLADLPANFDLEGLLNHPAQIRVFQKRGSQGDMLSEIKSIGPAPDPSDDDSATPVAPAASVAPRKPVTGNGTGSQNTVGQSAAHKGSHVPIVRPAAQDDEDLEDGDPFKDE